MNHDVGIAIELIALTDICGRLWTAQCTQTVARGARILLSEVPLWIHGADPRPLHRRARSQVRRLELEDDTLTWSGHCEVWRQGAAVWARDLGSDNGTWVVEGAKERVLSNESRPVPPGGEVRVGRARFAVCPVDGE